ncbi:TetR/AcrR family transcriptional regulator [Parasphingopyxis sp.]|uniref:TetR/AcrR family transcriptional regulator n=1 Tax=Parasphingopyxis sp. TaxID=1920299 RepID=UPI00261D616B|nr:TetR/AcrR family transcriptional regulator [Parasphingopyxis sp.]
MEQVAKRPRGTAIDWRKRRDEIAAAVLPLYMERHWDSFPLDEIAERLDIGYWQIYYSFDGKEEMYRAAVNRLVERLTAHLATAPKILSSVNGTARAYIAQAAEIIGSEDYARLLFFAMRDSHSDPWVHRAYEAKIADPLRSGLEKAVRDAGKAAGLDLILLKGAAEQFLTTLESALALPRLLGRDGFADQNGERAVAAVVRDISAATCNFDGLAGGVPAGTPGTGYPAALSA